jgi:hypothetical protein
MPLYSTTYLSNLASNRASELRTFSLNESKKVHSHFDIFLSHSFLDKNVVLGLYYELTQMNYKVYVDWIVDPYLDRTNVTKESATLVRTRLKVSDSLLYAISTNTKMSKWMPWELGFADGSTSRCAIVPIADDPNTTSFKGTEYLSLYPIIKKFPDRYNISRLWAAEDPNRYVLFEKWFSEKANPQFQTTPIY